MKLRHFILAGLTMLFVTSCSDDDSDVLIPGTITANLSQTDLDEDAGTVTVTFTTSETFNTDVTISYSRVGYGSIRCRFWRFVGQCYPC